MLRALQPLPNPDALQAEATRTIGVLVLLDSIRRISLRNFASSFATFAVSLDRYRKLRKGFRKDRKAKLNQYSNSSGVVFQFSLRVLAAHQR